jgi:hypothetical protein
VAAVLWQLDLEGRVLDVEVAGEAPAHVVELGRAGGWKRMIGSWDGRQRPGGC